MTPGIIGKDRARLFLTADDADRHAGFRQDLFADFLPIGRLAHGGSGAGLEIQGPVGVHQVSESLDGAGQPLGLVLGNFSLDKGILAQADGHANQGNFTEIGAAVGLESLAEQQPNGIGADIDGAVAFTGNHVMPPFR
ncbi:hypothetical protein DESC_810155 [Desulfosarcina cetonica]|nr:hypothetical protein DESC_810155 [Desulfosarcina cetonica]